ncbi:hypothetical protein SS50377_26133 [Spironucleus salmonicida]|nr:hypothetical protein SS50377_26133 [Spironucleus salmonicida]
MRCRKSSLEIKGSVAARAALRIWADWSVCEGILSMRCAQRSGGRSDFQRKRGCRICCWEGHFYILSIQCKSPQIMFSPPPDSLRYRQVLSASIDLQLRDLRMSQHRLACEKPMFYDIGISRSQQMEADRLRRANCKIAQPIAAFAPKCCIQGDGIGGSKPCRSSSGRRMLTPKLNTRQ